MRHVQFLIKTLVLLAAAATFAAPFFIDANYSAISHSVSESAAQHLERAWIMRAGFVAYGVAGLLAAFLPWPTLAQRTGFLLFGVSMILVAVFSHAPFDPSVEADMREDWLHSLFASVLGIAITVTAAVFAWLERGWRRGYSALIAAISIAIPLMMLNFPGVEGLLQRLMFALSYGWFFFVVGEGPKSHANKRQ